jgi:spatacsin
VMISARMFAQKLRANSEYFLMVKLLTGMGKFSWLSFVVDALIEDGQFEVLLGKAYDAHGEPPFAGELAMYLQERYPQDRNKLVLVFERSGMYRQLGQELEREGRRLLSSKEFHSLIKQCTGDGMETVSKKGGKQHTRTLSSSILATESDFHSMLLRIQDTFVGAAQGYAAAESFCSADRCWKMASLMQVQSRTRTRVVNITSDEVRAFLSTCKIFEDAMVVAESYDMGDLSSWVNPLYHRVIRAGEMMYLDSFLEIVPVPTSLFTEVSTRSHSHLHTHLHPTHIYIYTRIHIHIHICVYVLMIDRLNRLWHMQRRRKVLMEFFLLIF